jgi:hypothetical protein
MTTLATITDMAGITTVTTTTVIPKKRARSHGGEWAGRRCW